MADGPNDPGGADRIGVALVGCGAMGEIVARNVYAAPGIGFRVVAVVDGRPERRDQLAAVLDAPPYASLTEAAAAGARIDAVDVRVPHDAHAAVALEAMAHGFHVLVEKPVTTALADADALVAEAQRHGLVAAVAENYPHLRAVAAAADAIDAGELGELRALRTTRAFTLEGVWVRDGWRRAGPVAGVLLDQGTHHTSLLRRLGGEIESVSAVASRGADGRRGPGVSRGPEDTVLVTSRFASGLAAQSLYTWDAAAIDDEVEGTVFGSSGRIDIRVSYEQALGGAFRLGSTSEQAVALSPPENYYDSHRLIIEDWVSCIRQGRRPVVTVADGRADLAVVRAAARSLAQDGRPIRVNALLEGEEDGR